MVMDTAPKTGRTRTAGPDRPTLEEIMSGLLAVLVLFLTAIDALVTALLGVRPLTPILRQLRHVIADEYRAGVHGQVYADLVDDDVIGDDD